MDDTQLMKGILEGCILAIIDKGETYGIARNVDTEVQDEMMMNLFDMLLSAQEDEKPVEKIIGKDIEKFLKDYYQEYTFSDRIKTLPKMLYGLMKIIFIFEILDVFLFQDEGVEFFEAKSDFSYIIMGLLCGIAISAVAQWYQVYC